MLPVRRGVLAQVASIESNTCISCQWRSFVSSTVKLEEKPLPPPTAKLDEKPLPPRPAALEGAPRAYGTRVDSFTPKPLDRPIGMVNPPNAGQNTGLKEKKPWRQRRKDFWSFERWLQRRKEMADQMRRPYFRELTNMQHSKGKSFVAPAKLFRADRALYFPNLHGKTLAKDKTLKDTTPVLANKISIVAIYSAKWSENQVNTFFSPERNPGLQEILQSYGDRVQIVRINHIFEMLHAWLVKLFKPGMRRQLAKEDHKRYFFIRKGFSEEIREAIGILNRKVGYTYLLDRECRIRWAASGDSQPDEREGLVRCVRRLVEEREPEQRERHAAKLPIEKHVKAVA